jgi:hypothetical protein
MLDIGAIEELTGVLLDTYYDPLYSHSEKGKDYALSVQMRDPVTAAEEIIHWIERQ